MPLDWPTVAAFAIAAAAIVVSPGPDTMLILRYALGSGRSAGLAAVAGVQIGLFVHMALAVAGVSALIASSPMLLRPLAVFGAGYLAWLGLRALRGRGLLGAGYLAWLGLRALRGRGLLGVAHVGKVEATRACREAILCNVLNPRLSCCSSPSIRTSSRSEGDT